MIQYLHWSTQQHINLSSFIYIEKNFLEKILYYLFYVFIYIIAFCILLRVAIFTIIFFIFFTVKEIFYFIIKRKILCILLLSIFFSIIYITYFAPVVYAETVDQFSGYYRDGPHAVSEHWRMSRITHGPAKPWGSWTGILIYAGEGYHEPPEGMDTCFYESLDGRGRSFSLYKLRAHTSNFSELLPGGLSVDCVNITDLDRRGTLAAVIKASFLYRVHRFHVLGTDTPPLPI